MDGVVSSIDDFGRLKKSLLKLEVLGVNGALLSATGIISSVNWSRPGAAAQKQFVRMMRSTN